MMKDWLREGFKKKKKYGNFHTFADPPPKVWKIIFYFFSIVDHYWRFFGNFVKFPKISKGGTLGIFFQGYPPPNKKKIFNAFLDELRIQKKKCGTGLTPPPYGNFHTFFFEPFPYQLLFFSLEPIKG